MTPSRKIKDLLGEGVIACAFHDRSLFYASAPGPNSPHSPYLRFLLKSSVIQARLGGTPSEIAIGEDQCIDFLFDLNLAYEAAIGMLYSRFEEVFSRYEGLRRSPVWMIIRIADRNTDFTKQCACDLLQKSKTVTNPITDDLVTAVSSDQSYPIPSKQWEMVRNSGAILMEEITFLSGRVDHINNLKNSIYALMLALGGIGVSAGLTVLSIFVAILLANTGK